MLLPFTLATRQCFWLLCPKGQFCKELDLLLEAFLDTGGEHCAILALQGPPGLPTPAQNQPQPVTSQLLLTQLLQEQNMQNQMLAEQLEQLKLMQQQYSAHPSKTYTQPQDILDAIDPSLARELAKWAKDYKVFFEPCSHPAGTSAQISGIRSS